MIYAHWLSQRAAKAAIAPMNALNAAISLSMVERTVGCGNYARGVIEALDRYK